MWDRREHRLALLELYAMGVLRRRVAQADAWDELSRLGWARRTRRRDELAIDEAHRDDIARLLDRAWPSWRAVRAEIEASGLPVDESGLRQLEDRGRAERLPAALPSRLNQRTATAAVAPHSKATLTDDRLHPLRGIQITQDGVVRFRPNAGLTLRQGALVVEAAVLQQLLGEVVITERALLAGTVLDGDQPEAILLVENLGVYIDMPAPEGWLLVHVPGWDTATARLLLPLFADCPVVLFGDLDPAGVRIHRHLLSVRPDLRWAVPAFWEEYALTHAQATEWPADLDLSTAPPLVQRLARDGRWLEQEVITFDPRLPDALRAQASR